MNKPSAAQLTNRTMPSCTIIPVLVYPSLPEAIKWLTQVAGFKERWRVGNHRAQLTLGEDTIAISEYPHKALVSNDAWFGSGPVTHSMLVRVANVMSHYEHVIKKGAYIVQRLADFPYGERQYSVKDTGGHIWTFSQSIADLAPEDWGGTTATGDL